MNDHNNVVQLTVKAEKENEVAIIPNTSSVGSNATDSSLTTEEKVQRKVPRKPRRYPMSATAKEMKELLPKKVIQVGEKITWLTTEAAALYIGISPAALRQMVQRKQVVAYKPFGGRKLYFKKSDLDQAIETSKKVGGKKWQ